MIFEREKTCCFTGHRNIPEKERENIAAALENKLRTLIGDGYINFAAGGALGFDTIAAKCVVRLKKEFPHIKLLLILPCKNQSSQWSAKNIYEYEMLKFYADEIRYVEEYYTNGCYQKRNQALVDSCSICIAYLTKNAGGTAYTCNYANRNGVNVINLANLPENEQISLF